MDVKVKSRQEKNKTKNDMEFRRKGKGARAIEASQQKSKK
jgi:hypothetical protein